MGRTVPSWICPSAGSSRVQRATEAVNNALDEYRISDAAQAVYHFIWDEVCDWYIELAKARLGKDAAPEDAGRCRAPW